MFRPFQPCSPSMSHTSSRSDRFQKWIQQKMLPTPPPPVLSCGAHTIQDGTKDTAMTESNLRWLAFGWRNMPVVDFLSRPLICVTFSSYLYVEQHSLQSPWIHPLLKLVEILSCAARWRMMSLALMVYSLIAWLDFFVKTISSSLHCILPFLMITTWRISVFPTKCKEFRFVDSFAPSSGLHLQHQGTLCTFILTATCFFKGWWGCSSGWAAGKKNCEQVSSPSQG